MIDLVSQDEAKYQRDLCADEAKQDAIYDARDHLAHVWRVEYNKRGWVEWFGGDPNDELEEGESLGSLFDRYALSEVEANPEQYINGWRK